MIDVYRDQPWSRESCRRRWPSRWTWDAAAAKPRSTRSSAASNVRSVHPRYISDLIACMDSVKCVCVTVYSCRTVRVRLRQGGVRQGQGAGFGDLRRHGPRLQAPLQGRTFRNQNRDCAPATAAAAAEKGSTTTTTSTYGACCSRGQPQPTRSNEQQARSATNVHKSAYPVPMPVPVPVPAPVPKSAAALLPLPLLQAAAAMPDTTTTALSDTTTATCVGVQVPSMDAMPVPRPPVGSLLRGEPTARRPLRCHVTVNCCCRGGRAATAAGCCNCNLSRPCHFICMCASA